MSIYEEQYLEHPADCDCGHQHKHHHHEHPADCTCGCHDHAQESAEAVIEDAMILSKKGRIQLPTAIPAGDAFASLIADIREIAKLVAVDGVVMGHIKALLECEAGKAALSVTRLDSPDMTFPAAWNAAQTISSYTLTLNVLSVLNTNAPVQPLIDQLFSK